MKSQIIYSFEYSKLTDIKSQILKKCSQINKNSLNEYFQNTVFQAVQTEPLFITAYQDDQSEPKNKKDIFVPLTISSLKKQKQLLILLSCHTQHRFNWNLGKGIYLKKIYISPKVTKQMFAQFFEIHREYFIEFNFVVINVENNLLTHYNDTDFNSKNLYFVKQKQQFRQQYNPKLFQQINEQYPQIQFRYFQPNDYDRGLFQLLNTSCQSPKPYFEQFLQQNQQMNDATAKHIHIVGVDRQTGNIELFGTMLISDSLYGKRALGGNIIASRQARTYGNDELLIELLINEGLKDPQTKVNFYTIENNPYNSSRFSLQKQCTILLKEGSHFKREFEWQFMKKSKL